MRSLLHDRHIAPFVLAGVLGLLAWSALVFARSSGRIGLAQDPTGCYCHDTQPNVNGQVTVVISGPQIVAPNDVANYTIRVFGGSADSLEGGFNLEASGGTLIAGANNQLDSGELTHVDDVDRSWDFSWQAPASEGTVNFYAVGLSANGSGSSGDSWNWYGNAAGTPFPIDVANSVGVGVPTVAGLSLAPARPNPFVGATRIDFTLPSSGPVQLAVFDVMGRRVTALLNGVLPAGQHVTVWNGRDAIGHQVQGGVYLLTLDADGERITRKVVKASR